MKVTIENLAHDGRGVARQDGKTIFVDNALEQEIVNIQIQKHHKRFDEAIAVEVLSASPERQLPPCQYFTVCGGCRLQHQKSEAQLRYKEKMVLEILANQAGVTPETVLPPMIGPTLAYRRRARLGVKYVHKKQSLLVGFREKQGAYLTEMDACEILAPKISALIPLLKKQIRALSIFEQIPQVEVSIADNADCLVLRHLAPLTREDLLHLETFAKTHDLMLFTQAKGPDDLKPIYPKDPPALFYTLKAHQIKIVFSPTDFIQVNSEINEKMVTQAIEWLEITPKDHILDLFCGLGNFSLPLAQIAEKVPWFLREPYGGTYP